MGGGLFWNSRIWTLWQFSFWGGILKLSDWDSLTIFMGGGYSETLRFELWQFSFLGRGYSETLGFGLWQFSFGGYSETLGFGLSDNFHFGGYSETLGFGLWQFSFGGYSETPGFGLSDNFHFWGYSETLGFGLFDNFHLGGILKLSRFGLSDNFHFSGVFWNSDLDSFDNFHFRGGGILKLYFRIGVILEEFEPKFQPLQQAHASQIVSHILRMWRLINTKCKFKSFRFAF